MAKKLTLKGIRKGTYFTRGENVNDNVIYCKGAYNSKTKNFECINYHNRSFDIYLNGATEILLAQPNENYFKHSSI